ncbi:MAG TPA: protein kinase [Candidatus Eisenbacteria bacterium]|nr:protein kinase [Candidatus Eisenbacteria bacterium]
MPLDSGTLLGPYEILAPLGAGGMGEVYRARDTRLGREVAIKGLPAAFAQHPERLARFEREARLLASLNHPGIAILYGLEDADGAPFLVMELVPGETLAQRLARGPLPLQDALEVGAQMAAAISAAHERDIVHRDLKPGNVMLMPSGRVKVLDFGLAKGGIEAAGSSSDLSASPTMALSATGAGIILGTAAYMSPEQARGKQLDRRSDVWAFGCILFECLTARPVFAGETVSDTIARILEREPDWNALPPTTPPRLRDVLRRCLTKTAEDRPRDVGDIGRELHALELELSSPSGVVAAAAPAKPSLAVLYFENIGNDPDSDYFCSGITEDILTDLSKIKGLRVASRNAVQRYRGQPADLPRVAAELGVGSVLEGSVRRAGGRVRITAQLVNAGDGFQLWAERYDRTMDDVFAVQGEIASSIAEALRVALSPADVARMAEDRPRDVRAYDLYLKGRELYGQYTEASLNEALDKFRAATQVDPSYALAWAGIADCYGQLCQWSRATSIDELTRLGLEAARHALSLNPRLPEGHKALALSLHFMGDIAGTRAALLRALESDARFSPALLNLVVLEVEDADLAAGERYARRALDIDPLDCFAMFWVILIAQGTRREDEALALLDRVRRATDNPFYVTGVHLDRAWLALRRGDLPAAERSRREGAADHARPDDLRAIDALLAARAGHAEEARRIVHELRERTGIGSIGLLMMAEAAVRIGELDVAVEIVNVRLLYALSPTLARLTPALHPILDLDRFAPRRRDATLVWPLEAPMLDPSVHALFREVKIESGLPAASELRPISG